MLDFVIASPLFLVRWHSVASAHALNNMRFAGQIPSTQGKARRPPGGGGWRLLPSSLVSSVCPTNAAVLC